ncbi:mechanosensitive ion channel family protein [Aliidiomarina celeris]|uniref:mechanosensitive ion channel family protein n=1 Tax=Aliidiomarina celeris TaxID=2249428 RepID=UPI000DE823EF|nr:mechanosensitive ion channel family protein [Aliidiomarina celeris]
MDALVTVWENSLAWLDQYPQLALGTGLLVLLLVAGLSNFVLKQLLLRALFSLIRTLSHDQDQQILKSTIVARFANILPALVFYFGASLVPHIPDILVTIIQNVTNAFIILTVALSLNGVLTLINVRYERRPDASRKPIKGYVQVVKIFVYVVATILIIATLIDRSPLILLSGLGAMAAVLMLVFQDTLLSLVASMQISSNDIVRVGDWVEMPDANADGDVIDIALHTVKVQNWDRTITMIPTRRFITNGFKNWRGMQESGGRRIMRNLMLDQQSIRFLSAEEIEKFKRFRLLRDYLKEKQHEIDDWNEQLKDEGKEPVNTRRITNVGTFRAYVQRYLESHPGIHRDMMKMVRQLSPTPDGLPLQVYAFTNTTAWAEYEGIQSDIFDHLFAIVQEFGLRVYQHPSGTDLKELRLPTNQSS